MQNRFFVFKNKLIKRKNEIEVRLTQFWIRFTNVNHCDFTNVKNVSGVTKRCEMYLEWTIMIGFNFNQSKSG